MYCALASVEQNPMELRQLRQFITLAETLNFRAAAERLHMAQPPLSVSIRKLEEEIGARLFERSKRGVELTEAGRAALGDARKALLHAVETARAARSTAHGLDGRLRIGFVGTAKYALVPHLLPVFRQQYPEVSLEVREGNNGTLIQAINSHALDIAIVRYPTTWPDPIRHEIVEDDELVVALPADHLLAKRKTISLADIADERFIHYVQNEVPGLNILAMTLFRDAGFMPPVTQQAMYVDTAICLVESGFGVALVPSVAARYVSGRVVYKALSPKVSQAKINLAIIYDPNYEIAAARRFRALARDYYLESRNSSKKNSSAKKIATRSKA
jgi:DNA-binding transcriptional LysR family regulator